MSASTNMKKEKPKGGMVKYAIAIELGGDDQA